MLEVIKKLDGLVTLLETKNATAQALIEKVSKKKLALEDVERKQEAANNQLSARERILGKYEDFEAEKGKVAESLKRVVAMRAANATKEKELTDGKKDLKESSDNLETMKAIYLKKTNNIDALKKKLALEKKLMKEKILEEIKGKL